jgi:hypothetical protein
MSQMGKEIHHPKYGSGNDSRRLGKKCQITGQWQKNSGFYL